MSTIPSPETTRSIHPVHVGHLVMGLAFLGLVAIWAAVQYDLVSTDDVRWLLPLPWVFAGVAGLLAVVLSGRGRSAETPAQPGYPPDQPYADQPYTDLSRTDPVEADRPDEPFEEHR